MINVNNGINIQLRNFQGQNVVENGDIEQVIVVINNNDNVIFKINALFNCLSQANNMHGDFRGKCISTLETAIYEYTLGFSEEVRDIVNTRFYKNDPALGKVIEKVIYMTKQRFISNRQYYYMYNTKFSHHLDKIFKSVSNTSTGVGLGLVCMGTLVFTFSGIQQILSQDESSTQVKQILGLPAIVLGSVFTVAPVVEAIKKSATDEP